MEQLHIYRKSRISEPIKPSEEATFDKFHIEIKTLSRPRKNVRLGGKSVEIYSPGQYEIIKREKGFSSGLKEIWATGSILDGNSSGRFFRDFLAGRYEEDGYGVLYKVFGIGDDQFDYRYFTGPKKNWSNKGKILSRSTSS